MPSSSRVARGRKTQRIVADYWRPWYPNAYSVGGFEPGEDVKETPGLYVEVKATADNPILQAIRQAHAGAEREGTEDAPIVVWRPNGYGPESIDDWPVAMKMSTFIRLAEQAGVMTREGS